MTGKESKTPRQQSIIPANRRRRTNRCVLGCFARRRPFSPSLASWWPAGSESRSRATHHNHYEISVLIYVQTGLVGLSAHKKLFDVSRRRATCSPAPSRGICWSPDERAIRFSKEKVCAPEQYVPQSTKEALELPRWSTVEESEKEVMFPTRQ